MAVVVIKVEVVHGVACSAVDYRGVGNVFSVICTRISSVLPGQGNPEEGQYSHRLTDKHRPDIDEDEKHNVRKLLQWEQIGENVVRHTLCKAIERVKGVACVRGWHDPFVVRFMQRLVNERVVQSTVDPVDEKVREAKEEGELDNIIQRKWSVGGAVVKFRQTADFTEEKGGGEDCH